MRSLKYLSAQDIHGVPIEINMDDEIIYYYGQEIDEYTNQYRSGTLAVKDPRAPDKVWHIKDDEFFSHWKSFPSYIQDITSPINEKFLTIQDTRNSCDISNLVGFVSPDGKFFYIRINKNSSTKLVNYFENLHWQLVDIPSWDTHLYYENCKIFCVLRDPYSRYLSGLTQFLTTDTENNEIFGIEDWQLSLAKAVDKSSKFELMKLFFEKFDRFDFDYHTKLQSTIIGCQDCSKITFFFLDDLLGLNLTSFFKKNNSNLVIDNEKYNSTSKNNQVYSLIHDFFEDDNNLHYKENLLQYLKPDYYLINSVQFYAR